MPRIVLYGHAAYSIEDDKCRVPKNTTLTIYAPNGALLDKSVSDALANGEDITAEKIQSTTDPLWFFNRADFLDQPKPKKDMTELFNIVYPKTYTEGEKVPNFYLRPIESSKCDFSPIYPAKQTEVIGVNEDVFLSDIFEDFPERELHWAGCSFTRDDKSALGYGYVTKLKDERLKQLYLPPEKPAEVKRKLRAERFSKK